MPIINSFDEQEAKKPSSSSSANSRAGAGLGSSSGGLAGDGQGSPGATPPGISGGNASAPKAYSNLLQYISANQDSGATTGRGAANVVQQAGNQATAAQNAYQASGNQATTGLDKGLGVDSKVSDQIKAGASANQDYLGKIAAGGDVKTGEYNAPIPPASTTYQGPGIGDVSVSYGGPQNSGDFKGQAATDQLSAISANERASGLARNAGGGQTGVSALLKDAYLQPQYTAGENNLDSFLAGGTAGGQQALAGVKGIGDQANASYAGINKLFDDRINSAKGIADATNAAYGSQIDASRKLAEGNQATYDKAIADAKAATTTGHDKLLADEKAAAEAAAKKAEEDAKKKADEEAAAAAKVKADADEAEKTRVKQDFSFTPIGTLDKQLAGAQAGGGGTSNNQAPKIQGTAGKVLPPIIKDVSNYFGNTTKAPVSIVKDAVGAVKGDQKATNNTATTIATGGVNKVAPESTKTVTTAVKKAASDIRKKFGYAHGGEVPSYSKLMNMLRGK